MTLYDWGQLQNHIWQLEKEGKVTRTFRRLDPDRQQAVIAAILDEAVERGPMDINIKQVAERAGVAVGSLYTYFGNREGLLNFSVELCVRFMRDSFESFRPYLLGVPFADALRMYLIGGLEWSKMQIGLIRFFARAAYHSDSQLSERVVRPISITMRELVRDMLQHAVETGEVRPDIDLEATSRLLHGLTVVVGDAHILPYLNTYFQISDESIPPERTLDALVSLVLKGIGTKPKSD